MNFRAETCKVTGCKNKPQRKGKKAWAPWCVYHSQGNGVPERKEWQLKNPKK